MLCDSSNYQRRIEKSLILTSAFGKFNDFNNRIMPQYLTIMRYKGNIQIYFSIFAMFFKMYIKYFSAIAIKIDIEDD